MAAHRDPSPVADGSGDNLTRALAWMVFSGLCFAMMAATVRLAGEVALPAKVFFRNLVTLGITSVVAWRLGRNPLGATPHWWRLILRSVCGLGGVAFYFLALMKLDLAEASLLNKTSPFFVMLFAPLLLKEPFERRLTPIMLMAFAGALLVIKPGRQAELLPALAGLASGLCAGMAYTLVRSLKGRADPNRIIFTFSLISTLATLPFLIAAPPRATHDQWLALIGTGIFAAGGQYGLTFAYHHAPAARVSIFTYLHVVFAFLVGLVLWGERPDAASAVGGGLIVGAALWAQRTGQRA